MKNCLSESKNYLVRNSVEKRGELMFGRNRDRITASDYQEMTKNYQEMANRWRGVCLLLDQKEAENQVLRREIEQLREEAQLKTKTPIQSTEIDGASKRTSDYVTIERDGFHFSQRSAVEEEFEIDEELLKRVEELFGKE